MGFENNNISVLFHWSGGVWAITIVTLAVLAGAGFFITTLNWPKMMLWLKYLLLAIFLITVIVGVGYMPIRLKANDETITVRRLIGSLEIPLSEVTVVSRISKSDIDGSIRTFGSGGSFGYLGRFQNSRLGNYTMYATELNNLILIRTDNKKYVFSCTKAQDFVDYINSRLENR
jgi:hypothetical protein